MNVSLLRDAMNSIGRRRAEAAALDRVNEATLQPLSCLDRISLLQKLRKHDRSRADRLAREFGYIFDDQQQRVTA